MNESFPETDPRYLKGAELFNAADFFQAHEEWEELWMECDPPDRRFFQGLIHAAVAVYHFNRGNHTGAKRLFGSGRRYCGLYPNPHHGLDHIAFWLAMEQFLKPALTGGAGTPSPPRIEFLA